MRIVVKITLMVVMIFLLTENSRAIAFTGNAFIDFLDINANGNEDLLGDASLPRSCPFGQISGWDFLAIYMLLDRQTNQLHVGIDFHGLAGDADGDGDPNGSSIWLQQIGGNDFANMGQTESICFLLDFNRDGQFDVIAGFGAIDENFRVAQFNGVNGLPAFGFGPILPENTGNYYLGEDLEFTIEEIDDFVNLNSPLICIDLLAFAGSYQDAAGEDYLMASNCFVLE